MRVPASASMTAITSVPMPSFPCRRESRPSVRHTPWMPNPAGMTKNRLGAHAVIPAQAGIQALGTPHPLDVQPRGHDKKPPRCPCRHSREDGNPGPRCCIHPGCPSVRAWQRGNRSTVRNGQRPKRQETHKIMPVPLFPSTVAASVKRKGQGVLCFPPRGVLSVRRGAVQRRRRASAKTVTPGAGADV